MHWECGIYCLGLGANALTAKKKVIQWPRDDDRDYDEEEDIKVALLPTFIAISEMRVEKCLTRVGKFVILVEIFTET